jgi:hypothetical protein
MDKCPQCNSDKIKYRCCGGRRCEACQFKWNVKRLPVPPVVAPQPIVEVPKPEEPK